MGRLIWNIEAASPRRPGARHRPGAAPDLPSMNPGFPKALAQGMVLKPYKVSQCNLR